ncbi:sodium-dependent bicarbonate transport family permease [Ideonella sp. 4Y16]|uniref:Sodium-dependent bicarbonate transport family permease n=1 Tax=Ideonella alba TaxID=2824118 RepID=A0A940Y8E8_9BURK|nr:sodium-dependent bicarbonate transport family permease [Ideonella alba]MBQ0931807.1 sodium-dependent bicarbonate transport family permease [Ideonella alba]MBQ0941750.1 sodium-dependent bicarbonate transport family permease [Ideonella alba]
MNALLDPALLFFALGVAAGLMKSSLEVPPQLSRFLALYLLMALGLKGGFALARSGMTLDIAASLACAVVLSVVVPALAWLALRRLLPPFDALAVAATYGSVSAVTFITAMHVLEQQGTPAGGHMAAAMALMESPAILLAVASAQVLRSRLAAAPAGGGTPTVTTGSGTPLGTAVREACTDGGLLLLMGSLLVGLATGDAGARSMTLFTGDLFKGLLAFFLLDMGLLTARHLGSLRGLPPALWLYGVGGPLLHATLALALAALVGLGAADGAVLMVLAASASYIAVPAVLRHAVPEARPAVYVGLSLGLTFPFNLVLGIPLYTAAARQVLG